MTAFSAVVHQNEFLPRGWPVVHAIVTIAAREGGDGDGADSAGPDAVEVIMLDCSSSMGSPWSKIETAISATCNSIDRLRDGTWFAIIAGTSHARLVYPEPRGGNGETSQPSLARASSATRAEAKSAVARLTPNGGTRISTWLALARELLEGQPSPIQHAILLADGQN